MGHISHAQIPTDSLVAYYPFNGNANDESGNGNNGVVSGASLVNDRFGIPDNAFYFDGIDDNIDVTYQFGNKFESEYSVSLWIKGDSIQNSISKILSFPQKESTWNHPYHYLGLNYYNPDAGIQQFDVVYFDEYGNSSYVPTQDVKPNIWQHIVFTFDNGDVKIYVNNQLVKTGSLHDSNLFFPDHGFSIGSATFTDSVDVDFFTGVIDDIRMYNKVLSESEIEACYKEDDYKKAISRYRKFKFLPLPLEGFQYLRYESYYSEDSDQVNVYEIKAYNKDSNVALNKPTFANSSNGSLPENVVDGDDFSRWSSNRNDDGPDYKNPHYIVVDLEQKIMLDSIELNIKGWDFWNQTFSLLASPDSTNWYLIGNGDDTTGVLNYETNIKEQITVYDTSITEIYDTTNVTITDTVSVTDTSYVTVTDSVSVTDTLIIDAVITGTNSLNNTNRIKVYPNPAKDHLFVNTGEYDLMEGYQIKIFNQTGTSVFETYVDDQLYKIDLSDWTGEGLYFIQVFDESGDVIAIRKIILQ